MKTTSAPSVAREINRLHAEAVQCAADSRAALGAALSAAWEAGRLLIGEKQRVRRAMGGGAWLTWLQQHFDGTPRTAQRYMRLAQGEPDSTALHGLSLRQAYVRLGIATEPKSRANRAPLEKLPAHVRFAHKLVVALKPCAHLRRVTPTQCAAYRQDLRPLYELLRPLFEQNTSGLAFPGQSPTSRP